MSRALIKKSTPTTFKKLTPVPFTKFKTWCDIHGLYQRQIMRDTTLSIGTIASLWYKGVASKKTVKLLSDTYGYEYDFEKMITEFESFDYSVDKKD